MHNLILPGDPEFDYTLGTTPPPNWKDEAFSMFGEYTFIVNASSGLMRTASFKETDEYLYGGEYEERLAQIGDDFT